MSIWGKVIGGTAGMMFGGPLGAAVGAAMGHMYDRLAMAAWEALFAFLPGSNPFNHFREQARQTVFALAVLVLGGRLARVDGPLNAAEEQAFRRLFAVPDSEAESVLLLLRRGAFGGEHGDAYARRIADVFRDTPEVLEELLAALVLLGQADGPLNAQEEAFLSRLTELFGLPPRAWERVQAGAGRSSGGAADPYAVLGLTATASDVEIKTVYKRLLRENHPDALMARGLPPEFIEVANGRMAAINAAYDDIARRRGLK